MDAMTTRENGHDGGTVLEAVITAGDLARLTPAQRVDWYRIRCDAAGLDPRTQPFQYITLQGKLTLYATKTATEQLCARRGITTAIVGRDRADDLYIVTCRASADGRYTESIGAVSVAGLRGDALANALMKAETKAKRRAVLSLSGLGMLDETEVATIPGAVAPMVDADTGEVIDVAPVPALPAQPRQEPPPAMNGHRRPARPKNGASAPAQPADASDDAPEHWSPMIADADASGLMRLVTRIAREEGNDFRRVGAIRRAAARLTVIGTTDQLLHAAEWARTHDDLPIHAELAETWAAAADRRAAEETAAAADREMLAELVAEAEASAPTRATAFD